MTDSQSVLSAAIVRNLGDKLYEKRKAAALDIDKMVKDAIEKKDEAQVSAILQALDNEFSRSLQPNLRKGGMTAMAALCIGLGQTNHCDKYMRQIIFPVLNCFTDPDSRVRYYACEAMYNICKVARHHIIPYFNPIFEGILNVAADQETNVRNGAVYLNGLIKDIISESDTFDVTSSIPMIADRTKNENPAIRVFLVGWITFLDSLPYQNMLIYLPELLDGMFIMLSDPNKDIRQQVATALADFLKEIKEHDPQQTDVEIKYAEMVPVLCRHCVSSDEPTKITAIRWIEDFIQLGKEQLINLVAPILAVLLPCISDDTPKIRGTAVKCNNKLMDLIRETEDNIELRPILEELLKGLKGSVPVKLSVLRWVSMLHQKLPSQLVQFTGELFPALEDTLADGTDEVVQRSLEVLAALSDNDIYFPMFIESLVKSFRMNRNLLERRGSFIIRQLCLLVNPERVYRQFAAKLTDETDLDFANVITQALNFILLTASEVADLRVAVRECLAPINTASSSSGTETTCEDSDDLFSVLYRCWSHDAIATLSLCLLAQAYQHASELVEKFAQMEISVAFLVQMDKLVQLIESPTFMVLRLQLLESQKHPYLHKCLYGLLMLLPQSNAFKLLQTRLTCIPQHLAFRENHHGLISREDRLNFMKLGKHFDDVQMRHRKHAIAKMKPNRAPPRPLADS